MRRTTFCQRCDRTVQSSGMTLHAPVLACDRCADLDQVEMRRGRTKARNRAHAQRQAADRVGGTSFATW